MTDWNAKGLPPAAQRRIDNIRTTHLRSSLLSVNGATGVESAGFTFASEVMGAIVLNTTGARMPSCGFVGNYYGGGPFGGGNFQNAGMGAMFNTGFNSTYGNYFDIINSGWRKAIERMILEATEIGADGVVGVRLMQNSLGEGSSEFIAMGTAISSKGKLHLKSPFSTHLNGADFAKLVHSGYIPVAISVEVSVEVTHDDYRTQRQNSVFAPNVEIDTYTVLVKQARESARRALRNDVARKGAEGAIIEEMSLRIFETEPYENHRDHVAEVRVVGTSLVRFDTKTKPDRPMTFISLKDKR
ncbi:heavy metal-binding domain-containing protein [Acidithrix sp. C25]|uniref:heavy metal-binding domain-containing protein n=1 Tax=Acidithrix sp. C25 TaxID=1671482 RepID=UPI00191BBFA8|nr:heavy metal-binding domain-containing protein [Acidithrix sp. C25]CAG4927504.1 unnamed protein product [Acidithrix sp. C25]